MEDQSMTQPTPASSEVEAQSTILNFDVSRTRPGLRDMMVEADARLHESIEDDLWTRGEVTPEMVQNLLPDPARLWNYDDATVADLALKASLLALHAIQSGCWLDESEQSYFTQMQAQAMYMADHLRVKKSA
jgi:hypothetical protein